MRTGWETKISHNGYWPAKWRWRVERWVDGELSSRSGDAISRERAQRKAIKARLSMEREDVQIVEEERTWA